MPALLARFFGRPATNTQENPTPMTTATTTDEKPADAIIMRFLTLGGATVEMRNYTEIKERSATIATCLGCGKGKRAEWAMQIRPYSGTPYVIQEWRQGERNAREWANEHASECRAMPRPTAS